MQAILPKLRTIVEHELSCSAHNLDHIDRVLHLCEYLSKGEADIDTDILTAAALLHDIARVKEDTDPTGQTDHAVLGAEMAKAILTQLHVPDEKIASIAHCIQTHRYRTANPPLTKEAKILFDADKLDVLGAIGIARSYAITGEYGEAFYADIPLDDYIRENLTGGVPTGRVKDIAKHATNLEFELKLKHIPEKLHTEKAKALALRRVEFMRAYFEELKMEIRGEA
ncbi:MAG TPA: HD domain-containing protein [Bacillota bacterium]|jgi:uncharacterized protein|nr:HD domain-containing protein [Bacillota bacterium]